MNIDIEPETVVLTPRRMAMLRGRPGVLHGDLQEGDRIFRGLFEHLCMASRRENRETALFRTKFRASR